MQALGVRLVPAESRLGIRGVPIDRVSLTASDAETTRLDKRAASRVCFSCWYLSLVLWLSGASCRGPRSFLLVNAIPVNPKTLNFKHDPSARRLGSNPVAKTSRVSRGMSSPYWPTTRQCWMRSCNFVLSLMVALQAFPVRRSMTCSARLSSFVTKH